MIENRSSRPSRRALALLTLPLLLYPVSSWNCGKEFLFKASNLFGLGDEGDISFITLFIVICYIDNKLLTGALSASNSCARLIKSVECMQIIPFQWERYDPLVGLSPDLW